MIMQNAIREAAIMSLSDQYKRQFGWRSWAVILDALPPVAGQTVLDLGCAVGDQAAELVARGARVIGLDANEELLLESQARDLANAEFRKADLRSFTNPGKPVDGLWCSFAAAYFPDLPDLLLSWTKHLRSGGWVALTEIDNLFGHGPLRARAKALLDDYARHAFVSGRYDFFMGRRLAGYLERSGFAISKILIVEDREFSFQGPAQQEVVEAWRGRFDRMSSLRDFCGSEFERVREEFLACLARDDHCSNAKVYSCIAIK
jgi:SAM-dependent methyltransferase